MKSSGPRSSVGTATELRAGRSGERIPMGRDFPPVQTGPGAHPASCTMGTGSFPGVKYGRCAADHSHPSSAAVMKEKSYTSTHPLGHNRACNGDMFTLFVEPCEERYVLVIYCIQSCRDLLKIHSKIYGEINKNAKYRN